MRKRNPLLRSPDHRVRGLRAPSQARLRNLVSIRTPAGAGASVQVCGGRRVVPLVVSALVFVAAVVAGLAAVALVPATAVAVTNSVTARGSNTVTPIVVATNTPGSPIPVGIGPFGIAITPAPRAVPTPTPIPTPIPRARATTITLSVIQFPIPFVMGWGFAIPIADVARFNAIGSAQFKDGNTNIGGPVPVADGIAIGNLTSLPTDSHPLAAMLTVQNRQPLSRQRQAPGRSGLKILSAPG